MTEFSFNHDPIDTGPLVHEDALDACQEAAGLAQAIRTINEGIPRIEKLREAFQEPARRGLAREQEEPFATLVTICLTQQIPFEQAAKLDRASANETEYYEAERERAEQAYLAAEQAINEDVALAIEISPLSAAEYEAAVAAEKEQAKAETIDKVTAVAAEIREHRDTIDAFYEIAGAAWPVPLALTGAERNRILQQAHQQLAHQAREPRGNQTSKDRLAEWKAAFREEVNATIVRLNDDKLIAPEPLTLNYIQHASSSALLGTNTAFDRLVQCGLMRRSDVEAGTMTAVQIVVSQMLNAHRNTLGLKNTPKQTAALAIIEQAVADFFEAEARRRKD